MKRGSEGLLSYIRNNRMYLKSVRYEYKHNQKFLNKKPQGTFDYALAESYYESIRKELEHLEAIVHKLSTVIDSNFKVELKVLPNGKFDFEHIHIHISRSFALRDSQGVYKPHALMLHDTLYNVLIFVDCIQEVHLYSTEYKLSHCEVSMEADSEDLIYMIENISVPEKCFFQWDYAIKQFQEFAKNHYACNMDIPCDEGELCIENSVYGLSKKEFISTT